MGDEVKAPRRFSWGQWFGGSCLAAILCFILTLGAFLGWSFLVKINSAPVLIAVALLPGVIVAALAYRKRDGSGFLEGVITGACLVALLSGLCFGSMGMN
jgi:hypothetical protein